MKIFFSRISVLVGLLVLLDQITKYLVKNRLDGDFPVIGEICKIHYCENTGVAFSIPIPFWIIVIVSVIMIFVILYLAVKELDISKKIAQLGVALILSGGIGNLIDRIWYGFVIDFIAIWKYPAFNLADVYIVIGVLLILGFYGKIKGDKK